MYQIEIIMPRMGESVAEATVIKWLKNEGDKVEVDEPLLEIATDKVDSEIPSSASGILIKKLFEEGQVVQVGMPLALLETEQANGSASPSLSVSETVLSVQEKQTKADNTKKYKVQETQTDYILHESNAALINSQTGNNNNPIIPKQTLKPDSIGTEIQHPIFNTQHSHRFYSPLVKSIVLQEGISQDELNEINGSGAEGRVTKNDVMAYLSNRNKPQEVQTQEAVTNLSSVNGETEIIEMNRMRKLIAEHMVMSKQTSPHVTSFIETDVTGLVKWREKIKSELKKKDKENITYTHVFIEAAAKAIRDFPMLNVSVEGTKIIVKKNINIGMATALPTGNLIVPVIKNADRMSLSGIIKTANDLANRARNNKLLPDEIQGGTFTITNLGSFGNDSGTPIINQPQVAILATGVIRKKPAVIETPQGDTIGIRHFMFLSLSYDHRVIDGALGGSFLRRIADELERFDENRKV